MAEIQVDRTFTRDIAEIETYLLHCLRANEPSEESIDTHRKHFDHIWTYGVEPEQKLDILSTIWSNTNWHDDEKSFLWAMELLAQTLKEMSSSADQVEWPLFFEKFVRIVAGLGNAMKNPPLAVTPSAVMVSKVCDISELLCMRFSEWAKRSTEYESNLIKLRNLLSEFTWPFQDILLAQHPDEQQARRYTNLIGIIEYFHGLSCQLGLYPTADMGNLDCSTVTTALTNGPNIGSMTSAIRLTFISWIHGKRELFGMKDAIVFEELMQDGEIYRLFKAYPDIGARIALMYMFNEVQTVKGKEFKPSTYYKAFHLLKSYITYQGTKIAINESASDSIQFLVLESVLRNADWVLPWLWKHREIDEEFVLVATTAWMLDACKDIQMTSARIASGHPYLCAINKVEQEILAEILIGMFQSTFCYEAHLSSGQHRIDEPKLMHLNKLLWIVLQSIIHSQNLYQNSTLLLAATHCFIVSVDQEWINVVCWQSLLDILTNAPRHLLKRIVPQVQPLEKVMLIQHILLREMEVITKLSSAAPIVADKATEHLKKFTTLIQFIIFIASAEEKSRALLSKYSHFNTSLVNYIKREIHISLARSGQPELQWEFAASVAAVGEYIVLARPDHEYMFSKSDAQTGKEVYMDLLEFFLKGELEILYLIPSLCSLVANIPHTIESPIKPLVFLKVMQEIRYLLLDNDINKWCSLLPNFVNTTKHMIHGLSSMHRKQFIDSPWNAKMIHGLLLLIINQQTCTSLRHGQGQNREVNCIAPLDSAIFELTTLFLSEHPSWMPQVFTDLPRMSTAIALGAGRNKRLSPPITITDLTVLLGTYVQKGRNEGDTDGFYCITNAESLLKMLEMLPGTDNICKSAKVRIQRARKQHAKTVETVASVEDEPFYRIYRYGLRRGKEQTVRLDGFANSAEVKANRGNILQFGFNRNHAW